MKRRAGRDMGQPEGAPPRSSPQLRAFINYRREDTSGHAGRLYDSLTAAMGEENVFMDIDAIAAGEDFPTVINRALQSCDVLLALIGTRWLTVADTKGRPRLEDPGDFVRVEIEAGLERDDVVVIPVLVQETGMPGANDLPKSMAALTRRNAFQLSDNRWRSDIDRLILAMGKVAAEKQEREATERAEREATERAQEEASVGTAEPSLARPPARARPWYWFAAPAALVVVLAILYAVNRGGQSGGQGPGPPPHTPDASHPGTAQQRFKAEFTKPINASLTESQYLNPIFAHNAPDPTIIPANGLYYVYTTQSYYNSRLHLPVLVSQDLVGWHFIHDALPNLPAWADKTTRGDTWAPDALRLNGLYYLYYSARLASTESMGIAVATSKTPQGPFRTLGQPLVSGPGYRDIDPFVLKQPDGRLLMYWGSQNQPISVQPLSKDGRSLVGHPQIALKTSTATPYDDLVEGADVVRHGGFYYLFYSGDRSIGQNPHYAVLVARSRSPLGPFVRDPNNPIIEKNQRFIAPGHGTVFTDAAGNYFIVYHAMVRSDPTGARFLMLDRIQWQSGWPVVNGRGPSETPQLRPQLP
ncbi:MAG TPA: family 43 glycosylhydrolase [Actinomycetota bacterium]|nr:family 43 glycosylhydrolase [Actinomycetota bacterium]